MLGKNNKRLYQEQSSDRIVRYAIKRLTVGVGSVIVATSLLMAGNVASVNAQEINTDTTDIVETESIASESNMKLETEDKVAEESPETQDLLEVSEEIIPEAQTADQTSENIVNLNLRKSYETEKDRVSFENKKSFDVRMDYQIKESKMFEVQLDEVDPEDEPEDIKNKRYTKLRNFIEYDQEALDFLQSDDSRKYEFNRKKQYLNYENPYRTNYYNRRTYQVVMQRQGGDDIPTFKLKDSFGKEREINLNQKDETGAYLPFKFTLGYLDNATFIQDGLKSATRNGDLTQEIQGDNGKLSQGLGKFDDSVINLFEDKKDWKQVSNQTVPRVLTWNISFKKWVQEEGTFDVKTRYLLQSLEDPTQYIHDESKDEDRFVQKSDRKLVGSEIPGFSYHAETPQEQIIDENQGVVEYKLDRNTYQLNFHGPIVSSHVSEERSEALNNETKSINLKYGETIDGSKLLSDLRVQGNSLETGKTRVKIPNDENPYREYLFDGLYLDPEYNQRIAPDDKNPRLTSKVTMGAGDMTLYLKWTELDLRGSKVDTFVNHFEIENTPDENLPKGITVVDQEGKDGETIRYYKYIYEDGQNTGKLQLIKEEINDSEKRKVRYGVSTLVEEVLEEGATEDYELSEETLKETLRDPKVLEEDPIFLKRLTETQVVEDPSLPEGEVKEEGPTKGKRQRIKIQPKLITPSGETINYGDPVWIYRVIEAPKPPIKYIGTGVVGKQVTETVTKVIPFETETVERKDQPYGWTKVTQEGKNGHILTVKTQPTLNGQPDGTLTIEEKTIPSVKQIIEVGTGSHDPGEVKEKDIVKEIEVDSKAPEDKSAAFKESYYLVQVYQQKEDFYKFKGLDQYELLNHKVYQRQQENGQLESLASAIEREKKSGSFLEFNPLLFKQNDGLTKTTMGADNELPVHQYYLDRVWYNLVLGSNKSYLPGGTKLEFKNVPVRDSEGNVTLQENFTLDLTHQNGEKYVNLPVYYGEDLSFLMNAIFEYEKAHTDEKLIYETLGGGIKDGVRQLNMTTEDYEKLLQDIKDTKAKIDEQYNTVHKPFEEELKAAYQAFEQEMAQQVGKLTQEEINQRFKTFNEEQSAKRRAHYLQYKDQDFELQEGLRRLEAKKAAAFKTLDTAGRFEPFYKFSQRHAELIYNKPGGYQPGEDRPDMKTTFPKGYPGNGEAFPEDIEKLDRRVLLTINRAERGAKDGIDGGGIGVWNWTYGGDRGKLNVKYRFESLEDAQKFYRSDDYLDQAYYTWFAMNQFTGREIEGFSHTTDFMVVEKDGKVLLENKGIFTDKRDGVTPAYRRIDNQLAYTQRYREEEISKFEINKADIYIGGKLPEESQNIQLPDGITDKEFYENFQRKYADNWSPNPDKDRTIVYKMTRNKHQVKIYGTLRGVPAYAQTKYNIDYMTPSNTPTLKYGQILNGQSLYGENQYWVEGDTRTETIKDASGKEIQRSYVFRGLYTDPRYTEESKVSYGTLTMPDRDLALYEKWERVEKDPNEVFTKEWINTIIRENKDLPDGYMKVVQEGREGINRHQLIRSYINGEAQDKIERKDSPWVDAVDEIIEIGTRRLVLKYDKNTDDVSVTAPVDNKTYAYEEKASVKGPLVREGYQFLGWSLEQNNPTKLYKTDDLLKMEGNQELFKSKQADMILYAQWAQVFKLTYDGNGDGDVVTNVPSDSADYKLNQEATIKSDAGMTREGYYFTGWNTEKDGSGQTYEINSSTTMTKNLTLYAQWSKYLHLTYDGNAPETQNVPSDATNYELNQEATIKSNAGMTREGYYFTGWNTEKNGSGQTYEINSSTTMTENLTLYAQWSKYLHLTYDGNAPEAQNVPSDSTNYELNQETTIKSDSGMTREGYYFTGWNTEKDGSGQTYEINTSTTMTKNLTLYAQWSKYLHLTYDGNAPEAQNVPSDSNDYKVNDEATIKSDSGMTREGYYFTGWNTEKDGSGQTYEINTSTTMTKNLTLYAQWSKYLHLTYDGNASEAQNVPSDSTNYELNQEATIRSNAGMTREGYYFTGWNTQADGQGESYAIDSKLSMTKDLTLYAQWSKYLHLTYDGNAPETQNVPSDATNYELNQEATIKSNEGMTREGYYFTGWNTEKDGSGQTYEINSSTTMTKNLTLYAQWSKYLHLTYDGNAPETQNVPSDATNYELNQEATIKSDSGMTREGYYFTGWNTEKDGSGQTYDINSSTTMTKDLTLYAQWSKYLHLTYDGNAPEAQNVPSDSTNYELNQEATIRSNAGMTREGYYFTGWNTQADGQGESYAIDSKLPMTKDLTLYAQWSKYLHLTYEGNAPGVTKVPQDNHAYKNGDKATIDHAPLHSEYRFIGWNTQQDGKGKFYKFNDQLEMTQSIILYAQWATMGEPPIEYVPALIHEDKEIPFKEIIRENPNLPVGTRRVIQVGKNGFQRTFFKVTYDQKGNEIKREKLDYSADNYLAIDQIVEVGTGVTPEPEKPTPEPEPEQPTPKPEPEQPTPKPEPEQPSPKPEPEQPTPEPEPEQPSPEPEKTPESRPQPLPNVGSQVDQGSVLPQTGEDDSTLLLSLAASSILAGIGLINVRKKERD
ncbi:InlB B-repeat-containing protein [Facklamia hominis]|uniref:InlB B-repeat-containing protein n=1 Tax=Facklamia hominis TaxID=178214 RepID=UPI0038FCF922